MKHLQVSPFTNLLSKVNIPPYRESVNQVRETLIPTREMKKYEANIPQDFSVLIEDPHCLSINGWLASDGILYACRWRQHKSICKALDITTEAQMERAGYIKLTNMNWLLEDRYTPCKLTPEQITTIKRWYESNELSMDSYNHLKKHWSSE